MTLDEVMAELKRLGTTPAAKTYKRHGVGDNVFGVSFSDLGKLWKRIKVDHALALQLWETGNVDARTLATMIADPARFSSSTAESWAKGITCYLLSDQLAVLVAGSPIGPGISRKWMKVKAEFVRACGYTTLSHLLKDGLAIHEAACRTYLNTIEAEIHSSANRARYAMNNAVIAIAVYRPALTEEAVAATQRIGKVEVDHGETSCKTPDAEAYIVKTLARAKKSPGL